MEKETSNGALLLLRKFRPLLASLGGALVMLLAFFIPSVQDQWDRHLSRQVVNQYLELGSSLEKEGKYKMATDAYAKAFELSENKRLDIEIKRLNAKVNMVYTDPEWGNKMPDDLTEVDFQYLLHFQNSSGEQNKRVNTLICYGIYLAHAGRLHEAEKVFTDVIRRHPEKILAQINLGNLLDQEGKKKEAEQAYLRSIRLDPNNSIAHYNLGLLLSEENKYKEAFNEFSVAKKIDPGDSAIDYHYSYSRKLASPR